MPSTAIIGLQWGDEGKGKVIDCLAAEADLVVRYAGGNNAGHTVVVDGEKYVLHLIPGGILHDHALNLIGRGVVVNLEHLAQEVDGLLSRGVPVLDRLRLDSRCHLIFPFHLHLDRLAETWKGEGRIGTTGRGIGPAYADRVARTGIRLGDVLNEKHFETRLQAALAEKNAMISKVYGQEPESHDRLFEESRALARRFQPLVVDGGEWVREQYGQGKKVLFEGAQGSMLDLDAGTYPFVTSSWTGTWGIAGGTGMPPKHLDRALGVAKAYCTRVGEGPMLTELLDATGERLRKQGNEYGATTGRPRRCGWFDAVAARYAVELNGLDGLVLSNLDVLSGFEEIRVAVAYRWEDRETRSFPVEVGSDPAWEPVWKTFPGWQEDITGARSFSELPSTTQDYLRFLEAELHVPIQRVSVGPSRDQMFVGENGQQDLWA
ncbi:MAG: adenylosuccinate synthase [Planctomycetota bacterium]|nr:MAG: adenylosuccinate synthase [Planctomycetota bacterium]